MPDLRLRVLGAVVAPASPCLPERGFMPSGPSPCGCVLDLASGAWREKANGLHLRPECTQEFPNSLILPKADLIYTQSLL